MRRRLYGSIVSVLPVLAALAIPAGAADVKVIAARAFDPVLRELAPGFERETGHRLVVTIAVTAAIRKAIEAREAHDLVVTDAPTVEEWGRKELVAAATLTPVAYAGLGAGVRAGASRPDIGSVDAARRALLDAKSVAHSAESASAASFQTLLSRLGIAEEIRPRLRPMGPGMQAKIVASGEVDLLVAVVPSIVAARGLELAGTFPAALQTYTRFSAAVTSNAAEPAAARAAASRLTLPAARAMLESLGMEPGAP